MNNPYPYYDDRWSRALMAMCALNILALVLPFVFADGALDFGRISDPSWVPGTFGTIVLLFFLVCVAGTVILWINMWVYWARSGKPLLWLFLLLVGAWGPAIIYFFTVYQRDLSAYQQHEIAERERLGQGNPWL